MIDPGIHSPYPIEHVQIVDTYENRYLEEALNFIQQNALHGFQDFHYEMNHK